MNPANGESAEPWWRRENPWPYAYVAALLMGVGAALARLLGPWVIVYFLVLLVVSVVLGWTWDARHTGGGSSS